MAYIERLEGIIRIIFVAGLLIYALEIVDSIIFHATTNPEHYAAIKPIYWEIKLGIWITVALCFLGAVNLYFYLRFIRWMKQGLERLDNERFNQSFTFLYRSATLSLAGMVIGLARLTLYLWGHIAVAFGVHAR